MNPEGLPIIVENKAVVCRLKKANGIFEKVVFYGDSEIVGLTRCRSIVFWKLQTSVKVDPLAKKRELKVTAEVFHRIKTQNLLVDMVIPTGRFICRRGNPARDIRIIKFGSLSELTSEMFEDDYHQKAVESFQNSEFKNKEQPKVHIIDTVDEPIMEMWISPCGRYLLLNIKKPRLELWDLTTVPYPQCIQRYYGYKQGDHIMIPGFVGVNNSFIACGSEKTGEDACIQVWKRQTGELLARIPGTGFNSNY
mmetsp:Transcript_18710/g.28680  ORF Transcript_18710/g.28680 Transcript_18710/m.28680 type:complete len:251 (+) Transcript_18710:1123-1875(+)